MSRKRLKTGRKLLTAGTALALFLLVWMSSSQALAFEHILFPQTADTESWKTYKNDIYKFEIKYPDHWSDPWTKEIQEPELKGVFMVSFSSEKMISDNEVGGFLIYIFKSDACTLEDKADENAPCPSVELRKLNEKHSAYLYEASGEVYTYTFVPVIPEDEFSLVSKENIASQFEEAVETFNFDPAAGVVSVAVPPPKPAIKSNPGRVSAFVGKPSEILAETRTVNGRKVCAKKNDHPAPSKKNPKWQVDGECCLDPYEIPNSRCYYPPEKYGGLIKAYLAGPKR